MMKSLKLAALGLAALVAGCTQSGSQEVVLKVAHFLPANSNAHVNVIVPWCETLKAESEGRIRCQIYPSLQLGGTAATLVDQVRNGVADVVWTSPGYSPGRFPRVEALELPFMLPYGGMAGNARIWQFYETHAVEDFKGYKMLALFGDGGQDLHTRPHPVRKLEDFNGLKLRASGRTSARTLEALGATPVSMPPAQMTESISKGVIDGALTTWEVVPPTKLDEVTRWHSAFAQGQPAMGYTILTMLMNEERYAGLADDLKALVDRHSGRGLVEKFGAAWDQYSDHAKAMMAAERIVEVDAAEFARWQQATQGVADEWIKDAAQRGLDGKVLVEAVRGLR